MIFKDPSSDDRQILGNNIQLNGQLVICLVVTGSERDAANDPLFIIPPMDTLTELQSLTTLTRETRTAREGGDPLEEYIARHSTRN